MITILNRAGNEVLDQLAKDGAQLHAAPKLALAVLDAHTRIVKLVATHLARTVVASPVFSGPPDGSQISRRPKAVLAPPKKTLSIERVLHRAFLPSSAEGGVDRKHKPMYSDKTMVCSVCFVSARTKSAITNFAFAKCKGSFFLEWSIRKSGILNKFRTLVRFPLATPLSCQVISSGVRSVSCTP